MSLLLVDTNVASILVQSHHRLHQVCAEIVPADEVTFSFMTRAELLVWPTRNNWGLIRRLKLEAFIDSATTLYPDDHTCEIWADVIEQSRVTGRTMSFPDSWIAAVAMQWEMTLVTTDYRDFSHLKGLDVLPIS